MGLSFSLALFPDHPQAGALASPAQWLQCARAAEYAGLQGLSINTGTRLLDGLSIAALLATHTRHLQLSVSVATELLLPTALAASASSLQTLSGGRLQLHLVEEMPPVLCQPAGETLNRDQQRERHAEYLDILQHLLTPGLGPLDFAGTYSQIEQASATPASRSKPSLALDEGPDFIQLGTHADLCLLSNPHPRQVAPLIQDLRASADRFGRAIRFGCTLGIIVELDERHAWQKAEQHWCGQALSDSAAHQHDMGSVIPLRGTRAPARHFEVHPNLCRPDPSRPGQLVGTPHQIITRLQELEALGVDHIVLDLYPTVPQLLRIAEWILPAFRTNAAQMQGPHNDQA